TFFFTVGADTVDGGAGDDRAIYGGNLSAYTVRDLGTSISVLGSIGTNALTSVEHLQFDDGTINPDDGNPVFDTVLYAEEPRRISCRDRRARPLQFQRMARGTQSEFDLLDQFLSRCEPRCVCRGRE